MQLTAAANAASRQGYGSLVPPNGVRRMDAFGQTAFGRSTENYGYNHVNMVS